MAHTMRYNQIMKTITFGFTQYEIEATNHCARLVRIANEHGYDAFRVTRKAIVVRIGQSDIRIESARELFTAMGY